MTPGHTEMARLAAIPAPEQPQQNRLERAQGIEPSGRPDLHWRLRRAVGGHLEAPQNISSRIIGASGVPSIFKYMSTIDSDQARSERAGQSARHGNRPASNQTCMAASAVRS